MPAPAPQHAGKAATSAPKHPQDYGARTEAADALEVQSATRWMLHGRGYGASRLGPNPIGERLSGQVTLPGVGELSWSSYPLPLGGGGFVNRFDQVGAVQVVGLDVGAMYFRLDPSAPFEVGTSAARLPVDRHPTSNDHAVGVGIMAVALTADGQTAWVAAGTQGSDVGALFRINLVTGASITAHGPVGMDPNSTSGIRAYGSHLAVDPQNPAVVYWGTPHQGVKRTLNGTDATPTWATVDQATLGLEANVTNVADDQSYRIAIDHTSAAVSGRSSRVYVERRGGNDYGGVYVSTDGGDTFARSGHSLASGAAGFNAIKDMVVAENGTLYVLSTRSTVWTYAPATTTWTQITPSGSTAWDQIAVDPSNPLRVMVAANGGPPSFRSSTDGGATWRATNHSIGYSAGGDIQWTAPVKSGGFWTLGKMRFDPRPDQAGRLWLGEGTGFDYCDTGTGAFPNPLIWRSAAKGIEELVVNDIRCRAGRVTVAAMDRALFTTQADGVTYPSSYYPSPNFNSAWGVGICATDPNIRAAALTNHQNNTDRKGVYTLDGGATWVEFPTVPHADFWYGYILPLDADTYVWFPALQVAPQVTTNRGVSWTACSFGAFNDWTKVRSVASWNSFARTAEVDAGGMYVLVKDTGLFHSSDGATFVNRSSSWAAFMSQTGATSANFFTWHPKLKTTPGRIGHLWLTGGRDNTYLPLARSVDGGATWSAVGGFTNVIDVALGRAHPSADYPTLFVVGTRGGEMGLHTSTDQGTSWARITKAPRGLLDRITCVEADPDTFGRWFVGFAGSGAAMGRLAAAAPPTA